MVKQKIRLIGSLPKYNEKKVVIKEGGNYIVKNIDLKDDKIKEQGFFKKIFQNYINYFAIHFFIQLLSILIISLIVFFLERDYSYIDCLIVGASTVTSAGVATVDISTAHFATQFVMLIFLVS
jgi:hypothetical protein